MPIAAVNVKIKLGFKIVIDLEGEMKLKATVQKAYFFYLKGEEVMSKEIEEVGMLKSRTGVYGCLEKFSVIFDGDTYLLFDIIVGSDDMGMLLWSGQNDKEAEIERLLKGQIWSPMSWDRSVYV